MNRRPRKRGKPEANAPDSCSYRERFLSTRTEINRQRETCNSNQNSQQFDVRHTITSRLLYSAGALPGELPDHLPAVLLYHNQYDFVNWSNLCLSSVQHSDGTLIA
jgi:hypothetical protein